MASYQDYAAGGRALGDWLEQELAKNPSEIRVQTAYADSTTIYWLAEMSAKLTMPVHMVIGSGNQTLSASTAIAAQELVPLGGSLVIVDYTDALFHCKTYHVKYKSGEASAAVGSANCTLNGLGLNDESYIVIDTSTGAERLSVAEIEAATDRWRVTSLPNIHIIKTYEDVVDAINVRAIGTTTPHSSRSAGSGISAAKKTRLWSPPVVVPSRSKGGKSVTTRFFTPTTGGFSTNPTNALLWSKPLTATDAQQNSQSKKATLTLTNKPLTATYFRDVLFKNLSWTSRVKTTGNARSAGARPKVYEETTADFLVTIQGSSFGLVNMKIDHALHRIAEQDNVPTVLHWSSQINAYLRTTDLTNHRITITEIARGLYNLDIV